MYVARLGEARPPVRGGADRRSPHLHLPTTEITRSAHCRRAIASCLRRSTRVSRLPPGGGDQVSRIPFGGRGRTQGCGRFDSAGRVRRLVAVPSRNRGRARSDNESLGRHRCQSRSLDRIGPAGYRHRARWEQSPRVRDSDGHRSPLRALSQPPAPSKGRVQAFLAFASSFTCDVAECYPCAHHRSTEHGGTYTDWRAM